jgi:hypothetical protein
MVISLNFLDNEDKRKKNHGIPLMWPTSIARQAEAGRKRRLAHHTLGIGGAGEVKAGVGRHHRLAAAATEAGGTGAAGRFRKTGVAKARAPVGTSGRQARIQGFLTKNKILLLNSFIGHLNKKKILPVKTTEGPFLYRTVCSHNCKPTDSIQIRTQDPESLNNADLDPD